MKENWTYKKLGELVEVINGLWVGKKPPFINVAVVRNANFTKSCTLDMSNIAYIDVEEKQFKSRELQYADIIIEKSGGSEKQPVGRPVFFNIKDKGYSFSNFTATLRVVSSDITPEYLYKVLLAQYKQGVTKRLQSKTTGLHNLDFKSYLKSVIPIPSCDKQQSIVAELDEINNLLQLKKKELEIFDKLAQSIFYEMFGDPVTNEKGWEVKKLGDNVHEMFLGPFGSALKVDSYVPESEAYAMVYEQKHAIQATLSLENHFISEEKYRSLERFEVKGGDFIMSCRGTIGKLYRVPLGAPRGIIHPSLMKIRIKEVAYDPTFFCFMLKKVVELQTTKGNCVQMAITAKELGNKFLPLPPPPLQQTFANRIEAIEQQKEQVMASINKLETLLASRMQYWFD